jgi:hypothetical protein
MLEEELQRGGGKLYDEVALIIQNGMVSSVMVMWSALYFISFFFAQCTDLVLS